MSLLGSSSRAPRHALPSARGSSRPRRGSSYRPRYARKRTFASSFLVVFSTGPRSSNYTARHARPSASHRAPSSRSYPSAWRAVAGSVAAVVVIAVGGQLVSAPSTAVGSASDSSLAVPVPAGSAATADLGVESAAAELTVQDLGPIVAPSPTSSSRQLVFLGAVPPLPSSLSAVASASPSASPGLASPSPTPDPVASEGSSSTGTPSVSPSSEGPEEDLVPAWPGESPVSSGQDTSSSSSGSSQPDARRPAAIVGDSIALGLAQFWPTPVGTVEATVGIGSSASAKALSTVLPRVSSPGYVVVALGTNDSASAARQFADNVDSVLRSAQGRCVVWISVHRVEGSTTWEAFNDVLRAKAAGNARLSVVWWSGMVSRDPSLLYPDGVHPTPSATKSLISRVQSAASRCLAR